MKEKNFRPLKTDDKTLVSAKEANQSSIQASIDKKDIAKTVISSEEPAYTVSNIDSSNLKASSIPNEVSEQRDNLLNNSSMVGGTRMANAHESDFANRSGMAGHESQATAQQYATGGIRESLDSGKPIKVEGSSTNTANERNSAM